ncbi:uncharacterized protein [Mytilus edulis]|uniref:uncharacterized protein n=1 Tax=Mytilus edulis TaxID=6550 RepID=UPI0039F1289B
MFYRDNTSCFMIKDTSDDFYAEHIVYILRTNDNITSIVKEKGRSRITIIKPTEQYIKTNTFSCFDTSLPTTTQEPECDCSSQCLSLQILNTTQNFLPLQRLDKKTLS